MWDLIRPFLYIYPWAMKPNLPFVIVLILLLQLGSSSSICGFQECTGCVIASHSVPYWRGGRVCSLPLSSYPPTIVRWHRLCRLFLLSDRFVFDGPKSIYGLQPHLSQLRYIYSVCAGREIGDISLPFHQFLSDSFFLRYSKYMDWLDHGGVNATAQCRNDIYRYYCMKYFPPCLNKNHYAVFPCRENCETLSSYVLVLLGVVISLILLDTVKVRWLTIVHSMDPIRTPKRLEQVSTHRNSWMDRPRCLWELK